MRKITPFILALVMVFLFISTAIADPTVVSGGRNAVKQSNRSWILSSLGDSNSARGTYHAPNIDYNLIKAPLWTADTSGWSVGMIMRNSNNTLYYASAVTTGITGSTEPVHVTGAATDGGVTWTNYPAYIARDVGSYQAWAERYSNGALIFDQTAGFAAPEFSTNKCFVVKDANGNPQEGSGYASSDTITFTPGGTKGTLTIVDGKVKAVNITNSGRNATGTLSVAINTTTGSGAVVMCSFQNAGSFAVSGSTSDLALNLVPDACNSKADIFTVLSGSNDVTLNVTSYTTMPSAVAKTIANLSAIYKSLNKCGKKVIAMTLAPRGGQDEGYKLAARNQINRFVVAYAQKKRWANPEGNEVALVDGRAWLSDNSTLSGAQANYLATDNLHYITKTGQVLGYLTAKAAERWTGPSFFNTPRGDHYGDGYNLTYNPGGNMFEGLVWSASTTYSNVGDYVSNDTNKVYRLSGTVPCTTASSGGPTGTGSSITDGTCTWNYVRAGGLSVLGAGTSGTNTAAGGIVFTGTPPSNTILARQGGSASGTVVHTVESPRSDGRAGQRHVIAFSLGSGTAGEQWRLLLGTPTLATAGIPTTHLENKFYSLEVELEISGYANIYPPFIQLFGQSGIASYFDGWGTYSGGTFLAAGYEMLPITHPMAWGATQKMVLRTTPAQLPYGITSVNTAIYLGFNASGAADSATATIKLNRIEWVPVDM
jgi:hypothetical protein